MSHQSWLEQPYEDAARYDQAFEHWCDNVAEECYTDLLENPDEGRGINYYASPASIANFRVSGAIPTMRLPTFEEWIDSSDCERYFEEWYHETSDI